MVDSGEEPLRVLVVTVAHRGDDARIAVRQIGALRDHGAAVCYVAPAPEALVEQPGDVGPLDRVLIERATGWSRVGSWWQAYREVRRRRGRADVVLVHDLEAVLPVRLARPGCPVVWDVHEDMPSSVVDRDWIPAWAQGAMRRLVSAIERMAGTGIALVLAEEGYRDRLGEWPVVPNTTPVPPELPDYVPPERPYAVYVGRLSSARGLHAMLRLGADLATEADVVLVGSVDEDVRADLEAAVSRGDVRWTGPLPNPEALAIAGGAVVGLCLLAPLPNYTVSMPTKVYEYFAHGVPALVSPLPLAVQAVTESGAGRVVDPNDPESLAAATRRYVTDVDARRDEGRRGYEWVRGRHDWSVDGPRFVEILDTWAGHARTGTSGPGIRSR